MYSEKQNSVTKHFQQLCELVEKLRHPVEGCPWDLKQNHQTLSKYIIEEAYEAAAVMNENNHIKMCEELGDVLFQVLFCSLLVVFNNGIFHGSRHGDE